MNRLKEWSCGWVDRNKDEWEEKNIRGKKTHRWAEFKDASMELKNEGKLGSKWNGEMDKGANYK